MIINIKSINNRGLVNQKELLFYGYYFNEYKPKLEYSNFYLCRSGTYLREGGK